MPLSFRQQMRMLQYYVVWFSDPKPPIVKKVTKIFCEFKIQADFGYFLVRKKIVRRKLTFEAYLISSENNQQSQMSQRNRTTLRVLFKM